jgi:inositol oxygenase
MEQLPARPHVNQPKATDEFRNYAAEERDTVKTFYRLNHTHQTLDFVLDRKREYLPLARKRMKVWEALEYLNTLVDDSDPDIDLTQIEHAMQTAEATRRANQPRWFIVTGLIHDLGKVLCLYGEPQWAVVGDTFPVGCRFSEKCVYQEFFDDNPDRQHPIYSTKYGIYAEGIGLDHVHLSWGHDEYLFNVVRGRLPDEALAMIRYHSFYPWHKEGAYDYLASDVDRDRKKWVKAFNRFDLYSKGDGKPDVEGLTPFYQELVDEFFPEPLNW